MRGGCVAEGVNLAAALEDCRSAHARADAHGHHAEARGLAALVHLVQQRGCGARTCTSSHTGNQPLGQSPGLLAWHVSCKPQMYKQTCHSASTINTSTGEPHCTPTAHACSLSCFPERHWETLWEQASAAFKDRLAYLCIPGDDPGQLLHRWG